MNKEEIIRLRLFNQGLSMVRFETPGDVVSHFGAMQAQDYPMALWAVGLRLKNANRSDVENLVHSGKIIRTHILRPTWHFVHQGDIRWMMALSAPYVKKATQYIDKQEGLTNELFSTVWKLIEKQFKKTDSLTKENIMMCLSEHKIKTSNLLATQLIIRAELEMRLCNGEKKGSYALFDKRIPAADKISKDEAVFKLAGLYFNSRGPATVKDFAWWSGLGMSEVKTGIAALGKQLESFTFNGLNYFYFKPEIKIPKKGTSALLPCYDEYTVGYSEGRNIVLPAVPDNSATGYGIFKPIVLSDNEIAGTWKKTKKSPEIEIQKWGETHKISAKGLKNSMERVDAFFG